MRKKATIQDVADLAGVSKATVSKFINNTPYVSQKTKKKIEEAIKTLQFQPNSVARGLVKKSTKLIGLVVSNYESMLNMELIKAVEAEAAKYQFSVVLFSTNDEERHERELPEVLVNKYEHLDGIILANVRKEGVELDKFKQTFQHIVLLHRHIPNSAFDYVVIDGYQGGRIAAEHLVSLGHKKMAMITGPREIYQFQERIRGFNDVLQENGLHQDFLVVRSGQTVEEGLTAAKKVLIRPNAPTAIFASTDVMALGVLEAARDVGLNVPCDLSVIGFDNIYFSKFAAVPLTTIDARMRDLGEMAVRLLIERLEGRTKEGVRKIELSPNLVKRESCKERKHPIQRS
ncbi:LacI family DNA-binding transcriptional regulator [Halalkalibacter krulwichiae]|uniref:HTH-type transcriptional regulator DegA n=1 Tax=Halalkalibacter krulwichiae TaxID=199441 RepID=A0A1X9MFL1_9BACI|nr:LacI family DNA-binding transcriptional regulator [Halalkalibacter krulwichiae]ARK32247.1 HTH-type transcriptional regulator DegA [Halalkalibacter krulwichiae]